MARKYTRLEQRRYREKRRAQAARVAERLMGKKKPSLFSPDQDSKNFYNNVVRPSLTPWELVNEVKR